MKEIHLLIPEGIINGIKKLFPGKNMSEGIRTALAEYLKYLGERKENLEAQIDEHLRRIRKAKQK